MRVKVQDKDLLGRTVKSFDYNLTGGDLKTTATFYIQCIDENSEPLLSRSVNLTQEEYDNWGTDDSYIEDLFLAKFQLVKDNAPDENLEPQP